MAWGNRRAERVIFAKGLTAHIMAVDGSWRRDCTLLDISATGARLVVAESVAGLSVKEFFLVLSTSGRVFRRCGLVRVNGDEMGVSFIDKESARTRDAGLVAT